MSADSEPAPYQPNGVMDGRAASQEVLPSTPPGIERAASQQSLVSTQGPASPVDPSASFKTELNDDRLSSSQVVPSSLTPPPSSQVPQQNGNSGMPLGYISSTRANMFSPPTTAINNVRRGDGTLASEYDPPSAEQIADASADDLRAMFQSCLAENARLKMETAHHKLQYNLLSMQSDEDAKRAAVEHDMTRREVEVLRMAENSRQAKRELSAAAESTQAKYLQLKVLYEAAIDENDALIKRAKLAKRVIQQKEEDIIGLTDERDMLLTRIRENREHFHMLCSPGGVFHGALTPKPPVISTPQQHRATPRQTPRTSRETHGSASGKQGQAGFEALLEALSRGGDSAPSTPTTSHRPTPRMPPKHVRGVHSLSSLPTTPTARPRGEYAGLLPSVDLVPQTEPAPRFTNRYVPETPAPKKGRKSRESTISADDNEELARAALESVAAATQSFMSQDSRKSRSQRREEEEEVYESQASQAASEMLRRDPRESFEVASSVGSRDGTPAPSEKAAKLQAKLFASATKPGVTSEKRKFSGAVDEDARRDAFTSPTKKVRYGGAGPEGNRRVGLGIQY